MGLPPRVALTLVVALGLALPLSGCVANMGDMKAVLGFTSEAPPPPDPAPPVAVARANLTLTTVGAPVLFSSAGSDDPDGLITDYAWTFGDGGASGEPVVARAYAAPGEYPVRLTVTDDSGLTAEDVVTITVRSTNAAPTADLRITDTRGRAASSGDAGAVLTFSAGDSADPDGDPLAFEWDFGDGSTAVGEAVRHAFERPGTFLVRLTVRDAAGATATASRLVAQNLNASWTGEEFPPTSGKGAHRAFALPVPDGASRMDVTLRYEGELGTTRLTLEVRDAAGATVARAQEEGSRLPGGGSGGRTKTLTLTSDILHAAEGGDWTLVVTKTQGVRVTFDLHARVVA